MFTRLNNPNIEAHIFDVTTDLGVPSVLTHMSLKHHENRGIATGLCSSLNPADALEKSILECYQTLNWMIELKRGTEIELDDVKEFEDHVKYYMNDSRIDELAFMFECPDESSMFETTEDTDHTLENLISVIAKRGYSSYFVDLTTEDVKDLSMSVVRAIVPGLHPISCGQFGAHQDRQRLEKFLRWKKLPITAPINETLHPFP